MITDPSAIRDARPEDWEGIWPFFHGIVAAGETYTYEPGMSKPEGRRMWMVGPPGRTVVAADSDGVIVGTANMYANRQGPGSHVASASFMVDPRQGRRGIGRALGEDVIEWARESGFRAIQFNAVVETNGPAVALWRSLGFEGWGQCRRRSVILATATLDCSSCIDFSDAGPCAAFAARRRRDQV